MAVLQNGQQLSVSDLLGGSNVDLNGQTLRFEQTEESKQKGIPYFEAKGSDGNTYGFDVSSAIVRVASSPTQNFKEQRLRGDPIPRKEADRVDKEIQADRERAAEADAKRALGIRSDQDAANKDQKRQLNELKEEKVNQEQPLAPTTTTTKEEEGRRSRGRPSA